VRAKCGPKDTGEQSDDEGEVVDGKYAEDAACIEGPKVSDPCSRPQENTRDKEAGKSKEEIDSSPARDEHVYQGATRSGMRMVDLKRTKGEDGMRKQDGQDGDAADAIQFWLMAGVVGSGIRRFVRRYRSPGTFHYGRQKTPGGVSEADRLYCVFRCSLRAISTQPLGPGMDRICSAFN